jgi:hypothetical protein
MSQPPSFWLRRDPASAEKRPTRIPLSIYVLWHPSFTEAPALAREISRWFGGGVQDVRAGGLGMPVHFRSAPWEASLALQDDDVPPSQERPADPIGERERRGDVWRRPIDLDAARHNVFVPLVDDHMVDDPSWRRDLLDLAGLHHQIRDKGGKLKDPAELPSTCVHLAPIQVTAAWPRMPEKVSQINALYLKRWADETHIPDDVRRERWRLRARRLLTQSLVRLLGELRTSLLPTEVFLSHAKADLALGPGVAETLRDVAAGYGQIEVFYDENDLPQGTSWEHRMLGSAGSGAGFIAVLSDRYATRYWCRREIQLARTPKRVASEVAACSVPVDSPAESYIWTVRPSVVAVTLSREWSRLIGDLGAAPAIRWQQDDPEHAASILDQLFKEALAAEFQLLYARMLQQRVIQVVTERPAQLPLAFVTWTPDAWTLVRLRKEIEKLRPWEGPGLVVYPGSGFLPTEEADLDGSMGTEVAFCSFECLSDKVAPGANLSWEDLVRAHTPADRAEPRAQGEAPIIAISAGDADDLAALGYDAPSTGAGDSLHVDTAVLRLCREILQSGVRIAYGGVLRAEPSFTSLLHDTVAALQQGSPAIADPETPLENWIARAYEQRYSIEARAALAGLCRFYFVGPSVPADASNEVRARLTAAGLSAMRAHVARRTALTLAVAGKRWGFDGLMPGIAEEILCAMEATGERSSHPGQMRVILVGEFGGITREIVRYVLDRCPELPPALTLAGQESRPGGKLGTWIGSGRDARHQDPASRYADLADCLRKMRELAASGDSVELPRLGITVGEWRMMMTTSSIGRVRRLLKERTLRALAAGAVG